MKNKISISIVVIARNEADMIRDCLRSIQWADEVIVIDTGSNDKTPEIAQEIGAKVTKLVFQSYDFAGWRNRGLGESSGKWIFYLDADERVTPLLKKEILEATKINKFSAYAFPRHNFYFGKEMHYGGAWPDYVIRLFRKQDLKKWQGNLHEQPIFQGQLGKFSQPILHFTHQDLTSMLEKTINWTKIESALLFEANHPPVVWWRIIRMMLTKFWERVIKQESWRDGLEGWLNSIFEVFNTFIIYVRLWEIQQKV